MLSKWKGDQWRAQGLVGFAWELQSISLVGRLKHIPRRQCVLFWLGQLVYQLILSNWPKQIWSQNKAHVCQEALIPQQSSMTSLLNATKGVFFVELRAADEGILLIHVWTGWNGGQSQLILRSEDTANETHITASFVHSYGSWFPHMDIRNVFWANYNWAITLILSWCLGFPCLSYLSSSNYLPSAQHQRADAEAGGNTFCSEDIMLIGSWISRPYSLWFFLEACTQLFSRQTALVQIYKTKHLYLQIILYNINEMPLKWT